MKKRSTTKPAKAKLWALSQGTEPNLKLGEYQFFGCPTAYLMFRTRKDAQRFADVQLSQFAQVWKPFRIVKEPRQYYLMYFYGDRNPTVLVTNDEPAKRIKRPR